MSVTHLVTHSGGFHADEVLSSVILSRLFPDAEIVRTRDEQWISAGAGKIIYDVGRDYDADAYIFDHHQRPNPLRHDGLPFSSFGLIWKHFGRDYLLALNVPEADLEEVHTSFDKSFVLPIDLMDNGVTDGTSVGTLMSALTLPSLIESLKPLFDDTDPEAESRCFAEAVAMARLLVEASIRRKAAKRRAETVVGEAITKAGAGRVLELPQGMPFRSAVVKAGADHLLFVVHPRGNDWALTCIRKGDEGFENRADLPAEWAGLTDEALEAASGIPGAKFCHNGRFIAVASSRDAILAMAEIAVREAA